MTLKPNSRKVKLVKSTYRPTRAETEEPLDLSRHDGTLPSLDEAAAALMQPVDIEWIDKPE